MFVEWKTENAPFRDVILYFHELHIFHFLTECFFTKGNMTSARKVSEMCDEFEINRYKYVYTCFMMRKNEIEQVGFRYFNAISYQKMYVGKALDPTWYGYATIPTPVFDRIKRETAAAKQDKVIIIDSLLNGNLSPEAFAYLIKTEFLPLEDYQDIIQPLAATFAKPAKRVDLWVKRGVLPREREKMVATKNFKEWCGGKASDNSQA